MPQGLQGHPAQAQRTGHPRSPQRARMAPSHNLYWRPHGQRRWRWHGSPARDVRRRHTRRIRAQAVQDHRPPSPEALERHLQVHSGVRLRPPARWRPSHPAGLHPGDAQPALPAGHRNQGSRLPRLHPAEEGGSSRTPHSAAQGSPLCCPHPGPDPWSARSRPRQQRARCRPQVHSCGPFGVLRRVGRRGGHRGAQRAPCEEG